MTEFRSKLFFKMAKKFSFDVNSDTGNGKVAYEPPRQLVQYAGACTGKYKIRKRVPITQRTVQLQIQKARDYPEG